MVITRNVKQIGEINKLVLKMYANCEDIVPELEKILGVEFRDVDVDGETDIYHVLASYGWKHWKHYSRLWDVSGFIVEVKKFVRQCQNYEKTAERITGNTGKGIK